MAITALQGLLKTMCTALGQPRLLGKMAHALCTRFTKRLENPQTFLPKSHVGLVLQRVAELSPEFSSSAYLTDTQLSRLKRVPGDRKDTTPAPGGIGFIPGFDHGHVGLRTIGGIPAHDHQLGPTWGYKLAH